MKPKISCGWPMNKLEIRSLTSGIPAFFPLYLSKIFLNTGELSLQNNFELTQQLLSYFLVGSAVNSNNSQFCLSAAHRFQITKTRQQLHKKNLWNWLVILMIVTIRQFLNMQRMQSPETEMMHICWNRFAKIREITSGELIFGGF